MTFSWKNPRPVCAAFIAAAACFNASAFASSKFALLHDFAGADGSHPLGLAEDQKRNLFGNTLFGGANSGGVVFEFQRANKSYTYNVIYNFCSKGGVTCTDGSDPKGSLIVDTSGNVYGVTAFQGKKGGGEVFELVKRHGQWKLKILYSFCQSSGCADGREPVAGLAYQGQQSGALYDGKSPLFGTTLSGGSGVGAAYELQLESGTWNYQVIYAFCSARDCKDGALPEAPLIEDASGNLYGTTQAGGETDAGTAFELSFTQGNWNETVLHSFCAKRECSDGSGPTSGLTIDPSGNLYGLTATGGDLSCSALKPYGCGVVFMLSSANSWQETVLHTFCRKSGCPDGALPSDSPLLYTNGTLVGTAPNGGLSSNGGTLFELSGSTFQVIHKFCKETDCPDGSAPGGPLVLDRSGAILGATYGGGTAEDGVVYTLLPKNP